MTRPTLQHFDRFGLKDYVMALERYADQQEAELKTAKRELEACLRKYGQAIRRQRKVTR